MSNSKSFKLNKRISLSAAFIIAILKFGLLMNALQSKVLV